MMFLRLFVLIMAGAIFASLFSACGRRNDDAYWSSIANEVKKKVD